MKKLILGIIAVVVLQIAFFTYSAVNEPLETVARIVPQDIQRLGRQMSRLDPPEIRIPVVPQPQILSDPLPIATGSVAVVGGRTRPTTESKRRPGYARRPREIRADTQPSVRDKIGDDIVITRARSTYPRRHAIVLTDYSAGTSRTYFAEPSKKPAREVPKATTPAPTPARLTSDADKPRKRSYLARAFPALVKKPWNLMKTIASKLH